MNRAADFRLHPACILIPYIAYVTAVLAVPAASPGRLLLLAVPLSAGYLRFSGRLTGLGRSLWRLIPLLLFLIGAAHLAPGRSANSLAFAWALTGKTVLILAATHLLPAFSNLAALISFLHDCRLPRPLLGVLYFGLRYLGLVEEEIVRFGRAVQARTAGPISWRTRIMLIPPALRRFFLKAMVRSTRIHAAMLCRGYSGRLRFPPPGPIGVPGITSALILAALFLGISLWP